MASMGVLSYELTWLVRNSSIITTRPSGNWLSASFNICLTGTSLVDWDVRVDGLPVLVELVAYVQEKQKSSAAVQAFKAALTTGRDRAAAKRKEQMEDPATVTQFAAVFYLLKLGRPMTDIEHTPDLLRFQFAEVKRDAANSPGMGISQLWQSLSKQPITALEIFEYGRLAELAMVMVPGSGEEERMCSGSMKST
ncbi:hypothetical protein QJQ45_008134 [Haematococcus lacustris]|nr:hypothetical protein QJQ45_005205 [Haematococcus lacustris]KAJ9522305.1 hypothetical protein QJQ45_008134 [Haematococcus lacustris]